MFVNTKLRRVQGKMVGYCIQFCHELTLASLLTNVAKFHSCSTMRACFVGRAVSAGFPRLGANRFNERPCAARLLRPRSATLSTSQLHDQRHLFQSGSKRKMKEAVWV